MYRIPSEIQTLDRIQQLLSILLISSLTTKSFIGRWQILRSKLSDLKTSLSEISDCPHWSENPLLHDLLSKTLSTLHQINSLSDQCQDPSSSSKGKLLMQSDLDMGSASLSSLLHDIDLLLKSGVLRKSNAIVLSHPVPGTGKEELGFFIRDQFARLQIGGIEFKTKAMDSLLELIREDDKAAILVSEEGDVRYLVHLLDSNNQSMIREQAAMIVSVLATASDLSRKVVFEEGGLGPLLRLLETGSSALKEKAALAVESITADPENAWAISAYGGIPVLLEACRSGSPVTQVYAAGAVKNIAEVEEMRLGLAEEGVVTVLMKLLDSGINGAQEKAAHCIWILASAKDIFRVSILQEGGLQRLLQLLQESTNSDTLDHVLRSIYVFSSLQSTTKVLSSSSFFLLQLSELIKHGNSITQQISVSLLSNLSISDSNKREISGCMGALVKMVESSKPVRLQEIASQALISLLTIRLNRKDLVRDEKSVLRIVQMLDPKNEFVNKQFPVSIVSAILAGGSHGCRTKFMAAGAYPHLQKLVDMEVAGAKKALRRITGNRLRNILSRTWRE